MSGADAAGEAGQRNGAPDGGTDLPAALLKALKVALVVVGLCTPIVLLETSQGIDNQLRLDWRVPLVAVLAGLAFLGSLAVTFGATAASAQGTTWQNYRCADGTEFLVGFFGYDKRAHMQVDGKAVTLQKRIALGGSRYSGGGVTLRVTKSGTTFKIGKRPVTSCQLT